MDLWQNEDWTPVSFDFPFDRLRKVWLCFDVM